MLLAAALACAEAVTSAKSKACHYTSTPLDFAAGRGLPIAASIHESLYSNRALFIRHTVCKVGTVGAADVVDTVGAADVVGAAVDVVDMGGLGRV